MTVAVGGQSQRLRIEPGLHYAYLPVRDGAALSVRGGAAAVDVTGLDSTQLCISKVEMGEIFPSPSALAVPVAAGTPLTDH